MFSVRKGAKKRCCYGVCRSDTPCKSFLENLYYLIGFPKPCFEYRRNLIKSTKQKHIKICPRCDKCDLWVKRCGRGDGRFGMIDHVNKDTYICSLHFEGESGPTTEYPDPISCVKKVPYNRVKVIRTSLAEKYKQTDEAINQGIVNQNHPAENMDCEDIYNTPNNEGQNNEAALLLSHNVTSTLESNLRYKDNHASRSTVTSKNCEILRFTETLIEDQILQNVTCNKGVQTDIKKFTSKRTQVSIRQRSAMDTFEESIKNNVKKCKFYTSLEYEEIIILHNFVNPECTSVTHEISQQQKSNNTHQKLTSIQQLILVLMRLRVGTLVEDLAFRFEISTALVSKTIKLWLQDLYEQFTCNLKPFMFPSKKQLAETLPKTFKSLKNIRVIVDCTEFQCQSPSNFEHQGNLYSSYKARTTYKALIGCTPNGGVCFVSDVFEGSISDREIFIKSNIFYYLEPRDLVLADRGFTVHDIVESKQAYLNIPRFLNGRKPLSPQEEMETKRIAKQRFYIEHVIGRIKQFRLLQKVLPLSLR